MEELSHDDFPLDKNVLRRWLDSLHPITNTSWSRTELISNEAQPFSIEVVETFCRTRSWSFLLWSSCGSFTLTRSGPTGINSCTGWRQVPVLVRFTKCRIRRPA